MYRKWWKLFRNDKPTLQPTDSLICLFECVLVHQSASFPVNTNKDGLNANTRETPDENTCVCERVRNEEESPKE